MSCECDGIVPSSLSVCVTDEASRLFQRASHSCRPGGQNHRCQTEGGCFPPRSQSVSPDVFSRSHPLTASCVRSRTQGCVPLFVNATAGSTVYGAFDPINEIADICEKYNLWLHVDVSGSPRWSPRGRGLSASSASYVDVLFSAGSVGRRPADVQEAPS